jgi:transcriptional regulator with XRE-family HTH domain
MSTLAEIAGSNARALRREAGVNLQDFARAMRRRGLQWSTGRVGDFESGRAAPNLATLYVVAVALSDVHRDVTGRSVTLTDLFAGVGQVQINDKLPVQLWALREALEGKPIKPARLTASWVRVDDGDLPEWAREIDTKLRARVLGDFVETDERVCKRLGVARDVGAAAMAKLWRKTFTAERDRMAGPDAKPQHRGQISRQLQTKLEEVINQRGNDQ